MDEHDHNTVDANRSRMFNAIAKFFDKGTELLEDVRVALKSKLEDDAAHGRGRSNARRV